eukprot:15469234-Alexandrium_andersonii.AAC.1
MVYFAAGAHLMEAFYMVHASDPTNPHVEHTLQSGYPNVTLLDPRTPPDAVLYFKETCHQHEA